MYLNHNISLKQKKKMKQEHSTDMNYGKLIYQHIKKKYTNCMSTIFTGIHIVTLMKNKINMPFSISNESLRINIYFRITRYE